MKRPRALSLFTVRPDGYYRWYKGQTRFVCGKKTAPKEIESRWIEKRRNIDAAEGQKIVASRSGLSLIQLASAFYRFNDERVSTGKPRRMRKITAWDYERVINEFGSVIGPDSFVDNLGPESCAKYAETISGDCISRFAVKVSYLTAFIRWAMQNGFMAGNKVLSDLPTNVLLVSDPVKMILGPALTKPGKDDIRDARIDAPTSYLPSEIRQIWSAADETEKLWIGLALNCAFDNADLAYLPMVVPDLHLGDFDYRRRKRGKIRRYIPMHPGVQAALLGYRRPPPAESAFADLFFLTPTGLPLQRLTAGGQVDFVAMRWTRLMVRAGLRPAPEVTRSAGRRRTKMPADHVADGRGFRGLRTTFPNLAPSGFREEVEIIMGHAQGTILLDNYLERFGNSRLKHCITRVWHVAFSCPSPPGEECSCPWMKVVSPPTF